MNAKLTAKETALMTALAEGYFSFWDQGLVEGSGSWTEVMTGEIAGSTKYAVSATLRGVATVIASLGRKGLLITSTNEDGAWTDLTAEGEAWVNEFNDKVTEEEARIGRVILEQAAAAEVVLDTEAFKITHRNEDGTEWDTCTFADGSFTERRRKQVSGAWRTDFWGTTTEGERVSILSRDAKAAREAGTFTI